LVLRDQIVAVIVGTVFLFMGLAVCGIAAMRRRSGTRVLIWLGLWSATYGLRPLLKALVTLNLLPGWFRGSVLYVNTLILYMTVVVAMLAFLELATGKLRLLLQAVILTGLAIGVAGMGVFAFTGAADRLILYNEILVTCALFMLLSVVLVPELARKYLVLPPHNRRVLATGTLIFLAEALLVNLVRPLGYRLPAAWDALGFAALLLSCGYVAVDMMFASERRLLSIENELAIARDIQRSILPCGSPQVRSLRITTAYRPMTAVAGDFYEFVPIDQFRVGFLVADVSGHGVPAALIAAMIKVAMRSVVPCAQDPRAVLLGLNRVLYGQLHDQFVTASYLLIDTENGKAMYSAAGHPPLLRWRRGRLQRIESNGIVFGLAPDPEYPVCEMSIAPGDRFLLFTDGVIEPENARGDAFGAWKLEEVVRRNQSQPPAELADQLLSEIGQWQPSSTTQQDDITLIVIDVV
jgi:sigma-B regulation protein RsbU (phosphoserine phosphatase)